MFNLIISRKYRYLFLLIGLLIWSSVVNCGNDKKTNTDVFKKFYIALSYINFPSSQERLDECYVEQETKCIATYKRAIEAKNTLFSYGPETALENSIAVIDENCREGKRTNNAACNGAVYFLYYFDTVKLDNKILHYFKSADDIVIKTIFETNLSYWFETRPDKSKWVNYVKSSTVLDKVKKEGYIYVVNDVSDSSIALRLIKKNTAN